MSRTRHYHHGHAAKQLAKRYGEQVTRDDVEQLAQQIEQGAVPTTYLHRGYGGCRILLVPFRQRHLQVVWQPKNNTIITVLGLRQQASKRRHGR